MPNAAWCKGFSALYLPFARQALRNGQMSETERFATIPPKERTAVKQ